MMTVRVTRLMEYEYPNLEQAISGMEAWQVPPNGARSYGKISAQPGGLMIRSAVIGPVFGETAEQIADMTAVRGDLDEDPSIERAEEMRRELAGVMGINPTAPASLWEEMLRMIGAAGSVAPDVHADLVRRARDLVAALDDAGAVTVARGKPNNITIYRDRLRHWLQTYTAGLPAHMVAPDPPEPVSPVRDPRLLDLMNQVYGMWGGLGPDQRQRVRRVSEELYDLMGQLATYWGVNK